MFQVTADGPAASGRPAVSKKITKECVQHAWCAVKEHCDEHGPALSQAYGNFDRLVATGWLIGDYAYGCLIDGAVAFKVGRKAGKLAPGLKAEFDAPGRRVRKRKHASPDDWAESAKEEAALRLEPVEFDLPLQPPTAPAVQPPTAPAVQKRQRVAPAAPTASSERLELLKALQVAESLVADADCAVARAKREHEKAQANWDYVREQAVNPHRLAQFSTDEQWAAWDKKCQCEMDASRARLSAALRAFCDAEMAQFSAQHEVKGARFEMRDYEAECSRCVCR